MVTTKRRLFENGEIISLYDEKQIKVQGKGVGSYSVKGRLDADTEFKTISLVNISDFSVKAKVEDEGIYIGDIEGFTQITIESNGFDTIDIVTIK